MKWKSPAVWFAALLALAAIYAAFGPAEKTLGENVRVVYLHGAWVWAALAAFIAAGAAGLIGLLLRKSAWQRWSRALGRAGLLLWITYLPVSLWAMQTNWNGLFLAEPRWRMAAIFAIAGLLLQAGLSFLPVVWSAGLNLAYLAALLGVLQATENVMHPPGPMLESEFGRIQIFFAGLTLLMLLAAWQLARWFHHLETRAQR